MNLESVVQSGVSQKQKNKCHVLMHKYGIKKNGAAGPIFLGRNRDTEVENGLVDTRGEGEGGTNWESSIDIYTLLG